MTIDDLFRSAEIQRTPKQASPLVVRALSLLAISAVLTALAYVGLRLMELESPLYVLFAAALALTGLSRFTKRLRPGPRSRQAGLTMEDRIPVPDGLNLAVSRWDQMLDWCHTDVGRFNRRVLPRLGELVDERLRQKYGFTRATDPQRARVALGDPLWTYATMPHRRAPHPKELEQIITALEKL